MTPAAVAQSITNLQAAAKASIDKLLQDTHDTTTPFPVESICTHFTRHVAWRQTLGLNLTSPQETKEFYSAVDTWIGGLTSPSGML